MTDQETPMLTEQERTALVEELAAAIDEVAEYEDDLDQTACGDIWLGNPKECATACLPIIERVIAERDVDLSEVTRVVVVTNAGREFDSKGSHGGKGVQLSIQDDGQTLKVLPSSVKEKQS